MPVLAVLAVTAALAQSPPAGWRTHQDPRGRFQFTYPDAWGAPSPGTDDGFGDRTAAVRFSEFSAGVRARRIILGGEAVLTSGPPQLDLQAAGGLYDPIALQALTAPMAALIRRALPVLTTSNLCAATELERHLDPADRQLGSWTAKQREAVAAVDLMGNHSPKVLHCAVSADTVTFDKESAWSAGAASRHIYGAIRFLPKPYSSFQLIRGGADPPALELLQQITVAVNSWKAK